MPQARDNISGMTDDLTLVGCPLWVIKGHMEGQMDVENSLWLTMSFVHHIIIYQLFQLC